MDPTGSFAYVEGETRSTDFFTTPWAFSPSYNGGRSDLFVVKFVPFNTLPGSNIPGSNVSGVTATFSTVSSAGDTTVLTSSTGPAPPALFSLGNPPIYYDIRTTATYTGAVLVSITYDPSQFTDPITGLPIDPATLRLLHYDSLTMAWRDVTTLNDTTNFVIFGEVTSLSFFVIGSGEAPAPTVLSATVEVKPEKWNMEWGTKRGDGNVTVWIGNLAGHTAREIAPASIRLNGTVPVAEKGKDDALLVTVKEHRKRFDGPVLEAKVNTFDAFRSIGSVRPGQRITVNVMGTLRDGTPFIETDTVLIVGHE